MASMNRPSTSSRMATKIRVGPDTISETFCARIIGICSRAMSQASSPETETTVISAPTDMDQTKVEFGKVQLAMDDAQEDGIDDGERAFQLMAQRAEPEEGIGEQSNRSSIHQPSDPARAKGGSIRRTSTLRGRNRE